MTHKVSSNYTPVDLGSSNICVFIRARPLEDSTGTTEFLQVDDDDSRKVVIKDPDPSSKRYGEVSFQFDQIFWTQTQQNEVFETTCKAQVDHVLNGYNSCCFAYGQTGSGKTYTMFGTDGEIRGLIPRSVEYLFQQLARRASTTEVAMVCSFLEIYNDQIRDLGKAYLVAMGVESSSSLALYAKTSDIFENLAGKRGNPYFAPAFHRPGSAVANAAGSRPGLKEVQDEYNTMNYEIREDNDGNVFVKDLSLVPVSTMEEVMSLISMGLRVRATHETKMNAVSSRSHTVFTITVIQRDKATGQAITGMLNLVDLAGSERLKKSESQGVRLKEALHINTSLTALGKVIMALDPSSESTHIPYRDSKLTRVLQNSLGGNSYTSVIAAIHPSPRYYEECLSTLQFANRCRNVRNNPRVNYVDDSDDKDRKIKKLSDEVASLRSKLNQFSSSARGSSGGGAGGDGFSVNRLINILKTLGISASIAPDGGLMINGKKYALAELGIDGSGSASGADNSSGISGGSTDSFHGKDASLGNVNIDKLQKTIKELRENNETNSMRAKERKLQVEEQSRELQKINTELLKCRTTIKHKEFEYTTLQEEKEQAIAELRALLEAKHREEIDAILKANESLLKQQQADMEKIPVAVKEYTQLFGKMEKQRNAVEVPLRKEFEGHLVHIDKSRLHELENVRRQYEHFLEEKDKALQGFVDAFNAYRAKKTEQLRLAEREIVRLYDYTEQIETILDNVERGKYHMKQKQGAKGGKSTTGMMLAVTSQPGSASPTPQNQHQQLVPLRSGTAPTTVEISDDSSTGTGMLGAVVLPKGLRPINPLKLQNTGSSGLELTKKIVAKHKDRVARLEKMKEEAFLKSLHYAAQTGATATGAIDDTLKEQVRGLLAREVRAKSPTATGTPTNRAVTPSNQPQQPSVNAKKNRPVTIGGVTNDDEPLGLRSTAPGGLELRNGRLDNAWDATGSPGDVIGQGEKFGQALNNNQYNASDEIIRELELLRGQSRTERLSMQKILDELSSNEAFQYVQRLESEVEKLRKQLRDVTSQLQNAKVANASLSRSMDKNRVGTAISGIR
jgi:hypothetical protein